MSAWGTGLFNKTNANKLFTGYFFFLIYLFYLFIYYDILLIVLLQLFPFLECKNVILAYSYLFTGYLQERV